MGMVQNGIGIFEKMEAKTLTLSGITNPDNAVISLSIPHGLGVVPDFVLVYPKQRYVPPTSGGPNVREFQYCIYMGIASHLDTNVYLPGTSVLVRLYTNANNTMYEQTEFNGARRFISNVTSQDIQIGGNGVIANCGIHNGEYWLIIGKIADAYQQGEQVIH